MHFSRRILIKKNIWHNTSCTNQCKCTSDPVLEYMYKQCVFFDMGCICLRARAQLYSLISYSKGGTCDLRVIHLHVHYHPDQQ